MAWIFSLSAECGSNQDDAESFAKHFHEVSWQLSNGVESKCSAETFEDSEDNWWTRVCPGSISQVGIQTPEDAYQMTELGIYLYKYLQSAPRFRYALVGVEVDEFRTYSELLTPPHELNVYSPGLVLAETLWQLIGCPMSFRFFASGYVWKPYEGEVYKPLIASSNLKDKLKELLAV
ncbi:MAG TPA: hypothetical protein DCY88_12760 [Cyanobacteria bacterium UBA11372]|nr:hypothetical protein [Cyanobacteria bacterium UBA11372]